MKKAGRRTSGGRTGRPPHAHNGTVKRLAALVEAGQLLNSTLNLKKILSILLDVATKNLGAGRGTIYLVDRQRKELWSEVVKADKTMEIRLPLGKGIAGTVAKTGKAVNLRDAYKDGRFYHGIDELTGFRTKTMLCAPMRDKAGKIIGAFQILNKRKGYFTKEDEGFLESLSIPASIAIENARLHLAEIENQRIEKELEVAAKIQQHLLPSELPSVPGVQLGAASLPCRTVGGDFYDLIGLEGGKLFLTIADVSGKGIPSALLVSTLQASLASYLEVGVPLIDLVGRLNRVIYKNSTTERFITFVGCLYDLSSRTLRYVNAGHNYPFILRAAGGFTELNKGGVCLGLFPEAPYEEAQVQLAPGDLLILYTDGVTESMNRRHDLFGEARLYSIIQKLLDRGVPEIKQGILDGIQAFVSGAAQADDITLVLLKVL